MPKNAFGVFVAFPAENFVTVAAEAVEKIFLLGRGFLDEGWERGLEGVKFSGIDFEVRMQAHKVRKRIHLQNLDRADERVEAIMRVPGKEQSSAH
jgi:hypothetical protein